MESSRGTLNRESSQESLQSIFEESGLDRNQPLFREVFCFTYGVVVLWGYTIDEEHRFLRELGRFEIEKLSMQITLGDSHYHIVVSLSSY